MAKYSDEICDKICERIATESVALKVICKDLGISTVAVYDWLKKHPEFLNKYTRARESQADLLADEIIEIADNTSDDYIIDDDGRERINHEAINRSRLRVDARKWIASKLKPKKYGDKIDLTTDGEKLTQPDLSKLSYEQLKSIVDTGCNNTGSEEGTCEA